MQEVVLRFQIAEISRLHRTAKRRLKWAIAWALVTTIGLVWSVLTRT